MRAITDVMNSIVVPELGCFVVTVSEPGFRLKSNYITSQ